MGGSGDMRDREPCIDAFRLTSHAFFTSQHVWCKVRTGRKGVCMCGGEVSELVMMAIRGIQASMKPCLVEFVINCI